MNFTEFKDKYERVLVKECSNIAPDNPVVSICVSTYQHANYIRECLDGILMQETNFPFEVLIGEDCSTDGCREICLEYAEKFPEKIRLFLHHRENNIYSGGKPSGRFNFHYNLYSSRGKYLAFCEGDDYWTDPLKLLKQVNALQDEKFKKIDLCFHPAEIIYEKGKGSKFIGIMGKDKQVVSTRHVILGEANYFSTNSILVRKSALIDKVFFLRGSYFINVLGSLRGGALFLPNSMSNYRKASSGSWSERSALDSNFLFNHHLDFLQSLISFQSILEEENKVLFKTIIQRRILKILFLRQIPRNKRLKVFFKYQSKLGIIKKLKWIKFYFLNNS